MEHSYHEEGANKIQVAQLQDQVAYLEYRFDEFATDMKMANKKQDLHFVRLTSMVHEVRDNMHLLRRDVKPSVEFREKLDSLESDVDDINSALGY